MGGWEKPRQSVGISNIEKVEKYRSQGEEDGEDAEVIEREKPRECGGTETQEKYFKKKMYSMNV